MTEQQLTTLMQHLPHSQRHVLHHILTPGYRPRGKTAWRAFDTLVHQGVLVIACDGDAMAPLGYTIAPAVSRYLKEHPSSLP